MATRHDVLAAAGGLAIDGVFGTAASTANARGSDAATPVHWAPRADTIAIARREPT
jgi:hypothetical protein